MQLPVGGTVPVRKGDFAVVELLHVLFTNTGGANIQMVTMPGELVCIPHARLCPPSHLRSPFGWQEPAIVNGLPADFDTADPTKYLAIFAPSLPLFLSL